MQVYVIYFCNSTEITKLFPYYVSLMIFIVPVNNGLLQILAILCSDHLNQAVHEHLHLLQQVSESSFFPGQF
jgi:hypothetical protein